MRKELVEILCCPVCNTDLELVIESENEGDVIMGKLRCEKCDRVFQIEKGIPNLLP